MEKFHCGYSASQMRTASFHVSRVSEQQATALINIYIYMNKYIILSLRLQRRSSTSSFHSFNNFTIPWLKVAKKLCMRSYIENPSLSPKPPSQVQVYNRCVQVTQVIFYDGEQLHFRSNTLHFSILLF